MPNKKRSIKGPRRGNSVGNVTSARDLQRRYQKSPTMNDFNESSAFNHQSKEALSPSSSDNVDMESILNFLHCCQSLVLEISSGQFSDISFNSALRSSMVGMINALRFEQGLLILPADLQGSIDRYIGVGPVGIQLTHDLQDDHSHPVLAMLVQSLAQSIVPIPHSQMELRYFDIVDPEDDSVLSSENIQGFITFIIPQIKSVNNLQFTSGVSSLIDNHLILLIPITCHSNHRSLLEVIIQGAITGSRSELEYSIQILRCVDYWLTKIQLLLQNYQQRQDIYQLQATAQSVNDGVVLLDENRIITSVNPAYCSMIDCSQEDLIGKPFQLLDNNRYSSSIEQKIWTDIKERGCWQGELWNTTKYGNPFLQLVRLSCINFDPLTGQAVSCDSDGCSISEVATSACLFLAVINDNSRLHEFETQLRHLSNYDPLTNLPNRHSLNEHIKLAIHESAGRQNSVALVVVDLDHFKHINDGLGHPIGDRLLAAIAKRLSGTLSQHYDVVLARLSGDDFVVLLKNCRHSEEVSSVVKAIAESFQQPFDVGIGRPLFITASMGIALFPEHGVEVNQLLSNADIAMYQAKRSGRNQIKYYSHKMTQSVSDLLELTNHFRAALKLDNELQLYYQPQVDLVTRKTTAVEALMRWIHPSLGLIAPARFIPIAENSGLLPELDRYALQQACVQLQKWQAEGITDLRIAVNVSQPTFVMGGFIESLRDMIELTGIDPTMLELEITEGALLEPSPIVLETLAGIKSLGVKLAVDDFGTGYSSLAYLHRYHVDKLKIDQSFVQSIEEDNEARVITSSIIQLAAGLGLDVLAEGVETQSQLQFLLDNGCNSCQGFIFSRAVPASDLTMTTSCLCPLNI